MDLIAAIGLLSRWVHIVSSITILGSVIFARCALAGQMQLYARFRMALIYATGGLFASGLYNLLVMIHVPSANRMAYHAALGIKFLLALHVVAVSIVAAKPDLDEPKRHRLLTGVMISGFIVVLIAAYMRVLSR